MSVQHRQLTDGDVFFLFNESYEQRTDQVRIEGAFREALLLDPETGESVPADVEADVPDPDVASRSKEPFSGSPVEAPG